MLFINKRDFIKSKLKNKTVLFVNCYHPIAKEIIFFLSNLLKKEIRIIIIGKNPAYVSLIESKVIDKNDYRNERKKYVLSYDIDSRNYLHVKKAFKQIKEEWGKIDFIFHFDDYFFDKPIEEIPIVNFKYLYQWNQLTFFNILKAHQLFIQTPVRILTHNTENKKTLYHYIKNTLIDYSKQNYQNISTIILKDSMFLQIHKKITKQFLKVSVIDQNQIERILYDFLRNKTTIYL
ncbi:MAG: hypothetical protein QXG36_09175 [Nitrososphaeria archaeon]